MKSNCTQCLFDNTDVCSRGAGRAVNDKICEDFLRECKKCPEYDTINGNCPLYCKFIRDNLSEAIIFELEEIKAEILPKDNDNFWREADAKPYIKVIDKHISELKGENNENN